MNKPAPVQAPRCAVAQREEQVTLPRCLFGQTLDDSWTLLHSRLHVLLLHTLCYKFPALRLCYGYHNAVPCVVSNEHQRLIPAT